MKRWVGILFGSPDRVLTSISLFLGFFSAAFEVYVYRIPDPRPEYIVIRDVSLVVLLVVIIMYMSIKYFKKDELAEEFRSLLGDQIRAYHQMTHKFRDHYFSGIRNEIAKQPILQADQINEIKKEFFSNVCNTILTDTRTLLIEYFTARGLKIGDELTLTVKVIIQPEEAQEILDKLKGKRADKLNTEEKYIITAYRDPYTWGKKPERNVVKHIVYRIGEENTAFEEVLNKGKSFYFSNNLNKEYRAGRYKNENPDWQKNYNSVLVVPIRYRHQGNEEATILWGILSADSPNSNNNDLFDEKITFHMVAAAADILAIMFGNLDVLQITTQN